MHFDTNHLDASGCVAMMAAELNLHGRITARWDRAADRLQFVLHYGATRLGWRDVADLVAMARHLECALPRSEFGEPIIKVGPYPFYSTPLDA